MLETKKSVKVGDLWAVMGKVLDPQTFYLVNEVVNITDNGAVVSADIFVSLDEKLTLDAPTSVVFDYDEKITDSTEIAYWLLRMENAGN